MDRDLRETPLYREIEDAYRRALEPGFGGSMGATDVQRSPDGRWLAFTGSVLEKLEGHPHGRIFLVPTDGSTEAREITHGPNDDGAPRWSPDGRTLTFLSDRGEAGKVQLFALDADAIGEARQLTAFEDGIAEQHAWSPDGSRILVIVAGPDAEQSDAVGSGTVGADRDLPPWIPEVESSDRLELARRRLLVLDVATGVAEPAAPDGLNVWEASWCGDDRIAAVISDAPFEDDWYGARLSLIVPATRTSRTLRESGVQLGGVSGSPDGSVIAVVEAVCSDRLVVAGDLLLVDPSDGEARPVDTAGADVAACSWVDDGRLSATAIRGLDTVVLDVDAKTATAQERWVTDEACGTLFVAPPVPVDDGFAITTESWRRPPELIVITDEGERRSVAPSAHAGTDLVTSWIGDRRRLSWTAPDGLEIEGLVTLPAGEGPFPLILAVHGGPVWAYQDLWPGVLIGQLAARGYAILQPNPRGSWGRGRAFAAAVVGDMGGADARDMLAGVDRVVADGLVDPDRIGVMGGSYGGFMAAWLPCIDPRFKAAVSIAPVTDWYSERYGSNLGVWSADFLGGDAHARQAHYHERSPVLRAATNRTPTLFTAGYKDRATPLGQAVEMHRALREHGVESDVALYPLEGHGVRTFPGIIDLSTRTIGWFERFMPPDPASR
ncbi:MAG TPA: S9 family peptidase [Actinomycetota bacterium]|jgi:dipeptidyl aminopeptidase/acylaminoacyl peptidase